jgi:hypothetical protein
VIGWRVLFVVIFQSVWISLRIVGEIVKVLVEYIALVRDVT